MIKIKNLWKRYGKVEVLKGLDLDIEKGETIVILGRSGIGKSVLFRQILGIESPDDGYVEVNGEKITTYSANDPKSVVRSMGMLFQGAALFDSMDVGRNIGFYLRQHPDPATGVCLSEEEIERRVTEALELVDLAGVERKMPADLSGGMKKRAALARLIVYRPKILLYDEPTTGLDPITAMQINRLLVKIQGELEGTTSIVVTHDIRSAWEVGDRVAFIHDGVIRAVAPKEEFIEIDDPLLQGFFENAILREELLKGK